MVGLAGDRRSGGERRTGTEFHDQRVLIVDDQRSMAEAVGIAIAVHPGLTCAGIVGSVEEALDACASDEVDVVLMDVHLPGTSGLEGIRLVKDRWPDTAVYIFTGHTDLPALAEAAARGASGFFPKDLPIDDVLESLRQPLHGQMVLARDLLASFLTDRDGGAPTRGPVSEPPQLTHREWEVLELLCAGLDPQSIATRLGVSVYTSRGYVKAILTKLQVHSQLEAVVTALRNHWLEPGSAAPT